MLLRPRLFRIPFVNNLQRLAKQEQQLFCLIQVNRNVTPPQVENGSFYQQVLPLPREGQSSQQTSDVINIAIKGWQSPQDSG